MLTCPACRFSNPDAAKFCNNCGTPIEAARQIEGERKFATVLFADVARSTSIAEQLDPEDWAVIMNGAFAFMNAAVSRYGGTVSRLMGDAVLALFGAPVAHEDDAERAVRAGLEIQEAAIGYARTVKESHGIDFALRVGINTGTAVLAFVGDAVKTEYTAMGDAANVAARLQSAAEPGTVLISSETHKLVHALFDFRPRGALEMKGKQLAVESYEVLRVRAIPGRMRGLEGLSSPLVGRDEELSTLRDRMLALANGTGAVVAIVGEAGLGKSRLVAELRQARMQDAQGERQWYETRAISYGQSIPYYPWRQLAKQLIGATEGDSMPEVAEKLRAFLDRVEIPANHLPFLEALLGVDTAEGRYGLAGVGGDAMAHGVASAVITCIRSGMHPQARTVPQVLVFDDLHWSDSTSLELLAQVASLALSEPLLIVCVLRPDRTAASWLFMERVRSSVPGVFAQIDLEPLVPDESRELLGNLLHIEDLPSDIRKQIVERSEGNPFYLEEVLRSLIDCGQIVREAGHWRATRDILSATIPETLAGVLSARIDRLPEQTKRVAQTASVIGRIFQHRVLESACKAAPAQERIENVEPHIAHLSFEQLVHERARTPDREYGFKHALTCEAAYELLLRSRRRELHGRIGAVLESQNAEHTEQVAGMLARHFLEADDLERAVAYSLTAANAARRLYALDEELENRERAIKALERMNSPEPTRFIDAIIDWVFVRNKKNRYEGVLERLATAVELARGMNDKERLASALSWTGNVHMVTGYPSRSVPYLMESQGLAKELGNEQLMLLPLFLTTESLLDRDPRLAVEQFQEVISLARRYNMPDVEGHAKGFRAVALARIGEFAEAHEMIRQALEIAPHAGNPVKEADVHIAVSLAYYDMGDVQSGLAHAHIGADMAYAAGGMECACAGYYSVGAGELARRELESALHQFGKSMGLVDRTGWEGFVNLIRGGTAIAEFELGSTAAIDKLSLALNNAKSGHDVYGTAHLSERLAAALVQLGRWGEAEPVLHAAIDYYRDKGMRPYLARALELMAEIDEHSGNTLDAASLRSESELLRQSIVQADSSGGSEVASAH